MKENVNDSFEVDCRYDYTYDVLAIKVTRPFEYDKTVEMDEGVLLDFDVDNVPVSLEILDASKRLNVPKYSLKNLIDFKMRVSVDDKSICVCANFKVILHNKEQSPILESFTRNYSNIPSMETEFATA
ncbi:DUF2283 domain-containing protein [Methanobrevibacter sp.]|uniref:DUF2283 domain-containing protein n=1 Tax=Methanobrevibacter sp. TaxID=66852 RepID=UPI00386E14A1